MRGGQVAGEAYEPDPRRRVLRVVEQLIDKPLTLALVALAFAAAARGPGLLIEGYRPSGWFTLGMWVCLSVMARLAVLGLLARYRAAVGLAAGENGTSEPPRAATED
jgi:hypothetical protein